MSQDLTLREKVAEEIRVLLARRKMSASELARQIGLTQRYMSRRLTGETAFDVDDLEKVASVLGVEVTDLMPRSSEGRTLATVGTPGGATSNDRSSHRHRRLPRMSGSATLERLARHLRPDGRPQTSPTGPTPAVPPTQRRANLIGAAG